MQKGATQGLPSVRIQLLGLVAAVVVPLLAVTIWAAWNKYEADREALGSSLIDLARALSTATDRELAVGRAVVETLAASPLLDTAGFRELHARAVKAVESRPGTWIVLWDRSGQQLLNTLIPYGRPLPNVFKTGPTAMPSPEELPVGDPWSVRAVFETQQTVHSNLFIGIVSKRPSLTINVPIFRDGQVRYAITYALPTDAFQALLQEQKRPSEGGAQLADGRGFVIARAVNPEPHIGRPVSQPLRDAMQRAPQQFFEGQDEDGRTVLRAYARSSVSGWTASMSLSREAALAPVRASMWQWGAAVLALLVVGIAATLWLARRIAEPLRAAVVARERDAEAFRTMANANPAIAWTAAPDGTFTFVSDRWFAYTGLLRVDPNWTQALHADDIERCLSTWRQALAAGTNLEIEARIRRHDGEYRWFITRAVPIRNKASEIAQWIGSTTDIHDSKLATAKLSESKAALQEADRRKNEFMATLAHELRNPLAAIGVASEIMNRSPIKDERGQFAADVIARQTHQLQRLVDDLLDVARAMHGKLKLTLYPLELLEIARQVVAIQLGRSERPVKLEAVGEQTWVNGDPVRLHQMISNLVENAIKYGGTKVVVRVSATPESALVSVDDNGQGIEPDLLPRLFEPFVQGDQSLDAAQSGLGLGLTLTGRLAALHGGSLTAQSDGPGQGSSFTIRLPRIEQPLPARVEPTRAAPAIKRRVLVVEDDEDSRESLRVLLEMEGHDVYLARDGVDGLAALKSFQPDIALVDLGLPGVDGYELARRARSGLRADPVTLVALSGYGQDKDRQRAREAGFDHHLTKPIAYDQLVQAFKRSRFRELTPDDPIG